MREAPPLPTRPRPTRRPRPFLQAPPRSPRPHSPEAAARAQFGRGRGRRRGGGGAAASPTRTGAAPRGGRWGHWGGGGPAEPRARALCGGGSVSIGGSTCRGPGPPPDPPARDPLPQRLPAPRPGDRRRGRAPRLRGGRQGRAVERRARPGCPTPPAPRIDRGSIGPRLGIDPPAPAPAGLRDGAGVRCVS